MTALQGLQIETAEHRVRAELKISQPARNALVEGLRDLPLATIRSLLPPIDQLLGTERR